MMSHKTSRLAVMAGLGLACILAAEPACAAGAAMTFKTNGQTLGQVANNLANSLKGVGVLVTMCCYLGALFFGVLGALKWKAYGEQPDRTPFKIPVTFWGVAVLLAGFPEFMGTGIVSLWGTGAQLVPFP